MPEPLIPEARFVPAAGVGRLTRFYDSIIALTVRERLFRGAFAVQVLAGLKPGSRIVDIGAGTGSFAIQLSGLESGAEVIGVDTDAEVLRLAQAKPGAGAVTWKRGQASLLPLPDESCDRAVMSLVLHHLDADGKRAALAEARRVLRPGGRLHIADWGKPQDPLMRTALFVLAIFDGFDGIRDHAAGRIPAFVAEAGFEQPIRHDRFRTAWGSLELLSAVRA
jgi:ubiquinone/menaquinone biosynthesis C-methylase UbiE